jgi:hypothetical protein
MAVTVVTQTSILILFLMSALGQKRKNSLEHLRPGYHANADVNLRIST